MGIDISGFSKAKRVTGRHSDECCEEEAHYLIGTERKLLDGLRPNSCYISQGRSYYFGISYGSFETWQNAISLVALSVPVSEVLVHPRRYKGQPFVELIAFPECNDVGIGPHTSAKLHRDFMQYAVRAKKGFQKLAAEAASQKPRTKTRPATPRSETVKIAQKIANDLGAMVVGGEDDPDAANWQWKWEVYRDFRRRLGWRVRTVYC